MRTNCKLVALAPAFLMLVAPAFGARAASKAKIHHRHYVAGQANYAVPPSGVLWCLVRPWLETPLECGWLG